jgi:predicted nuclease of predicted toxin-antitoxin system
MRFLVDANLSPRVTEHLRDAGHDAVHVYDLDLGTADDNDVLVAAADDERALVTADADFGALLALSGRTRPSVVLLRSADHLTPDQQGRLLTANISAIAADLETGAIASLARGRLRIRSLPLPGDSS